MFPTESAAARLRPRSVVPPPGPGRGHRLRASLTRPGRGAGALLRTIGAAVARWRSRRKRAAAIRDLRAWNDWMLKDIGLTRGEIIAAVDGRLQRDRPGRPSGESARCERRLSR